MVHDLAFLHTVRENLEAFERMLVNERPRLLVRHLVADRLLKGAREHGLTEAVVRDVHEAMTYLADTGARVVVCTCSTIGGAAETTPTDGRFVAMRIDRPMADRAVQLGPNLLVLAALESTLGPTRTLIEDSARRANATVQLHERVVEGAWDHFEYGNREAYYQAIAGAMTADTSTYGAIVLAQASMAPAADLVPNPTIPILTSPRLGLDAVYRLL